MHRPSGVPAAHPKLRLDVREDDQTYAPPPMSAFALAVLNRTNSENGTRKHDPRLNAVLTHQELKGGDAAVAWERRENSALKESLGRKLAEQLNNSSSSISTGVATQLHSVLKSPAALHTRSSFGSTGATGITSNLSSDRKDNHATTSQNNLHLSTGIPSVFEPRGSHEGSPRSVTFDAVDGRGPDHATNSAHHHSKSWSEDSAKRLFSARSSAGSGNGSENDLGNGAGDKSTSLPKLNGLPGALPLPVSADSYTSPPAISNPRILSIGSSGRKSRMRKALRSLGPPKRPSDVNGNLPNLTLTDKSNVETPPELSEFKATHSPHHQSGNGPMPKRQVSPQSDFFKSLKTLREASPNAFSVNGISPRMNLRSPSVRLEPFRAPHSKPDRIHQRTAEMTGPSGATAATSAEIPPPAVQKPPGNRPPLQDVSRDHINLEQGVGSNGFKKPRIPGAAPKPSVSSGSDMYIAETPPVQKDPTPQLQSRILNANSEHFHSSHSDDDNRRKVIRVNGIEYDKLEILGRGGTSKVYKVRSHKDRKSYALKKVSLSQFDESCISGFKGEIELLQKLRSEVRVVSLVDHAASSGSLYLLMECGDIDLAHVLQNKLQTDPKLDTNFVRFHASEVFHCIQAVHNAGIVHSDLKPANFLFVGGILKIIDFGIANAIPEYTVNIYRQSQIGTPNYMAPEALVEVNHTRPLTNTTASTTWRVGFPSDIWSCGCIIYQMIYGRPPYASYSGQQRILAIMNPQVQVQYPAKGVGGVAVPLSAIELIQRCLERDPKDRWTIEECLDSNFIKPKAVNPKFVRELLHSAVNLGRQRPQPDSIDDRTYDELVGTILKQIKDLDIA